MTFALMRGYDHINVVARLDPVAAVRDRELGERIRRYPKIFPFGSPDFGHAVQSGNGWRVGALGADEPCAARYGLAMDLRTAAAGEPDPAAPCGRWEAQLRLNLVGFMPAAGTVPEVVRTEARHAIQAHPGVVLLPPTFVVVELDGDSWTPLTGGDDPGDARARLARHFTGLLPRLREFQGDPPSAGERAEWEAMAAGIRAARGHAFRIRGREFRTVRVSRMLRLGRDGPEAPRPSDEQYDDLPADA